MKPRLLANENFPAPSIQILRDRGYDVAALAESDSNPGDPQVLALATAEQRWILTFDRDYGELIFARGLAAPPAVFLFRMRSYRPESPRQVLAGLLDAGGEFEGYFVLVEDAGQRKRPLPVGRSVRG